MDILIQNINETKLIETQKNMGKFSKNDKK